ncbi:hypothetical protein KR059_005456, partial [Drosophila kikkawai]
TFQSVDDRLNMETVLQHAALVSTACTGRTLGEDRAPLWEAGKTPIPQETKEPIVKLERSMPLIPVRIDTEPSAPCFPDADAINASIVRRELAEEAKKSVRQQLHALKERQEAFRLKCESLQREEEKRRSEQLDQKALREQRNNLLVEEAEKLTRTQLEAQQREQLEMRHKTDSKLHKLTVEGVSRCQQRFRKKYEGIAKLLLSLDRETVQVCSEHNKQLKELGQQFDQLVSSVAAGKMEQSEFLRSLIKAEQFCKSLQQVEQDIIQQLAEFSQLIQQQLKLEAAKKLEEEEQQQQQLEEEKRRQQQEKEEMEARQKQAEAAKEKVAPPPAPATAPAPAPALPAAPPESTTTTNVHPDRLQFYNEVIALYQGKVDSVKPLQTEESLKQYRTGCQRAINLPLNAISAVSPQHLSSSFEKLYNFFAGQPVKVLNGTSITINDHPLARDYCLLLMAKKFVSQTETAISSNPQAAFPFASVIATFWKLMPDFGKVFLAYLYKESPFLVPYVIPQQPGQTPEAYLKTIGYRLSDNNELEKPDNYLKRQTGIARLYAAVIITPGRKADGPEHCFGLEEGWRWLAHVVHVKPLPDVSATLIMEILQTLGFELWRTYGKQFVKLLLFIQNHYLPQLAVYDEGGPKTRLEMLLAKFLRERQIPQAVGVLPPGFW